MSPADDLLAMRKLRLVTYNIHKGIGGIDRRYRPERIVETLAGFDADLVFLQEVDEGAPRSRGDRQVDLLGDALGYAHRAYVPNVRLRRGHYGNALLSRLPFDHQENIDLSVPLKKRRSALHARISVEMPGRKDGDHRRLWIFNVHLGLADLERRAQLRRVLAYQGQHRMHHDTAVIIAGDYNDVWGGLGRRILEPQGYVGSATPHRTFPAWAPLRPLDRVFVRGPITIEHSFRGRAQLARLASDHLPVVAELVLS